MNISRVALFGKAEPHEKPPTLNHLMKAGLVSLMFSSFASKDKCGSSIQTLNVNESRHRCYLAIRPGVQQLNTVG